jgi:hypothetical protein
MQKEWRDIPGADLHHAAREEGDVLRLCDVRVGENRLHAHQLVLFGQAGVLPDQQKVLYTCPKEVR